MILSTLVTMMVSSHLLADSVLGRRRHWVWALPRLAIGLGFLVRAAWLSFGPGLPALTLACTAVVAGFRLTFGLPVSGGPSQRHGLG